jgi:hypothetical protein
MNYIVFSYRLLKIFEILSFSCFLVNSADRIIRVYESGEVLACGKDGEPEPIQKLQDLVNRFYFSHGNCICSHRCNFICSVCYLGICVIIHASVV